MFEFVFFWFLFAEWLKILCVLYNDCFFASVLTGDIPILLCQTHSSS